MDLVLWRHAEAEPHDRGNDLARALTKKGQRQAEAMAEWLDRRLAHLTRVLVSPATRCQQTVKPLGRKWKTVDEIAPGSSGEALLAAAKWPRADEPVLLVGHQPSLGLAASLALTGRADPWAMKKGAVWWLRQRDDEVVVQAVMSVDSL